MPHVEESFTKTSRRMIRRFFRISSKRMLGAVMVLTVLGMNIAAPLASFATGGSISVTLSVDKEQALRGDTLFYTGTIRNTGTTKQNAVYAVLQLQGAGDYVNGSGTYMHSETGNLLPLPNAWTHDGANFGYVLGGESVTIKFKVRVHDDAPLQQYVQATLNGSSQESPSVRRATVSTLIGEPAQPKMSLEQYADRTEASSGDAIHYTIRMKNTGNVVLHNVYVVEYLPNQEARFVDYISGSGSVIIGTTPQPLADRWIDDGAKINYLNPGQEAFIKFTVTVRSTAPNGQVLFSVANVRSDELPQWMQCSVKTTVKNIPPPQQDPPHLTVIKHVINNDGGIKHASDFTLDVSGSAGNKSVQGSENGVDIVLVPGSYSVTEQSTQGYQMNLSQQCSGTLANGDRKVCVVTNDDKPAPPQPVPPRLTVIKHVVNNDGGTKQAGDFSLHVQGSAGTRSFSGVEAGVTFDLQPGTYTVTEDQDTNYTATSSADCAGSLVAGQTKVCVITNDDKPAPQPQTPSLTITKDVLQSFTNPDTTVSYRIAVRNVGAGTAQQVRVDDALPFGFTHTGNNATSFAWFLGDLAPGQESSFTYTARVGANVAAGFYTNTATASAANASSVSDTATLEVRTPTVIGESTHPNLVLSKTVSVSFVNPGGKVTYHLVLENRGDGVAENVVITDTLPPGFTVGSATSLSWNIGDLVQGARWEDSFDATVGTAVAAGTYRNVAVAKADNNSSVEASASVEVRKGEVLGISTIPATGGSIGSLFAVATRVLASLAVMLVGLVFIVDPTGRIRRHLNPEARLLYLIARARQER